MSLSPAAASLAATAIVALLTACGREQTSAPTTDSTEPEMTQPAPTDSTYTGGAGRKEDGPAAEQSAAGDQETQPSAPQQ